MQLLVAPLQGQAYRCCPFVVVDAESSSSTWLLEQKPCQPQQTQPHCKMHQSFPRDVLWEERRKKKIKKKKKWEFVAYGVRWMPYPHLPATPQTMARVELTARKLRNLQHMEKHAGCQYPGETSTLKRGTHYSGTGSAQDLSRWDWPQKSMWQKHHFMNSHSNHQVAALPNRTWHGQVGSSRCPSVLLTYPGPGFRNRQVSLFNGTLIYPKAWKKSITFEAPI